MRANRTSITVAGHDAKQTALQIANSMRDPSKGLLVVADTLSAAAIDLGIQVDSVYSTTAEIAYSLARVRGRSDSFTVLVVPNADVDCSAILGAIELTLLTNGGTLLEIIIDEGE